MRCVLVIGGAGYIGSHCAKALSLSGFTPVSFDNLSTGHKEAVKWGPLEIGDILDTKRLIEVINRHNPEFVIHLAASAYVGESIADPQKYYSNNVIGSLSILDAMRETNSKNIIFSSTCATYGIPELMPITEITRQDPVNPYGFTKFAIENAIKDYSRAYGIRFSLLRYFNAAGADPAGEIGECHTPETHAIPLAILAALRVSPPFKIFGTDYPTPDGTAIRDYIHVSDLASGHVLAASYLINSGQNNEFNLGTGHGTSVSELVKAVERCTDRSVPIEKAARRHGDPPILLASPIKARDILGWRPKYMDIDEIIKTAASWFMRTNSIIEKEH